MEGTHSTSMGEHRTVEVTAKGFEEKLNRLMSTRKDKLGQLTGKMNRMSELMHDGDHSNLQIVQTILIGEFNQIFGEFCELNNSVKVLLKDISDEEMNKDQDDWFTPKADAFYNFSETTEAWMKEVHLRIAEAEKLSEEVYPSDSVSVSGLLRTGEQAPQHILAKHRHLHLQLVSGLNWS